MDIQQVILDTTRRTEGKVDELNTRVTSLEIEVRNMGKRVNGLNGCAKELASEVEELSQESVFREKRSYGRKEFIKIAGIVIGSMGVAASIVFSILALICH